MWQSIRSSVLDRRAHEEAHTALVISGGYEEAGDRGRFQVKAGDIIFHGQIEVHLDHFSEGSAVVLNLRLPIGCSYTPGISRVAERNRRDAIDLLLSAVMSEIPRSAGWPDELAHSFFSPAYCH